MADEGLDCLEIARRLGISSRTVVRWAAHGRIPRALTSNGRWVIRIEDLAAMTILAIAPGDVPSTETE